MNSQTEMTLRAVVDGRNLGKVRLPDPVVLSRHEAETVAAWARPFSGTCLTDLDVHVGDIKPSNALMILSELPASLSSRIRDMLMEARRYGFGLRVMRETANDPYEISITRRVIDVAQLTIPHRSMQAFLHALGYDNLTSDERISEGKVVITSFAERLASRIDQCMYAGVAHYREYCLRIVEYGRANGAREIIWGPERRGAVPIVVAEGEVSEPAIVVPEAVPIDGHAGR